MTNDRTKPSWGGIGLGVLALVTLAYHVYYAIVGLPHPLIFRPAHLLFFIALPFLVSRRATVWGRAIDIAIAVLSVLSVAYILLNFDRLTSRYALADEVFFVDVVFGTILIIALIEGCRRYFGLALPILTAITLIFALFGHLIPGRYGHPQQSPELLIDQLYLSTFGIFGSTLGTSSDVVYILIVFGAFMSATRVDQTLIRIAKVLFGRTIGGPAKVAVGASALLGSISGSTSANIMTTGTITIPMMRRHGYSNTFAGGVEAAASTGGQILPPVMGATAFLMAGLLGVPYLVIMQAALLPAVLYFLSLYLYVHLYSVKHNLAPLRGDELGERIGFADLAKLIPLGVLTTVILMNYSPRFAVLAALASMALLAVFVRDMRIGPRGFLVAARESLEGGAAIAIVCGIAGIIIGMLAMTGIGIKLAAAISVLGENSLFLSLVITMVVTVVFGMGVPTPAAYVAASAVMAPVVVNLGLEVLAAHMFIFYFAALSSITPPVAVGAFVAAGLAHASPMRIAVLACRLAIVAYVVPFILAYNPESLFMRGPIPVIIIDMALLTVGFIALVTALEGWAKGPVPIILRVILFGVSGLLIVPMLPVPYRIAAMLVVCAVWAWSWRSSKRARSAIAEDRPQPSPVEEPQRAEV